MTVCVEPTLMALFFFFRFICLFLPYVCGGVLEPVNVRLVRGWNAVGYLLLVLKLVVQPRSAGGRALGVRGHAPTPSDSRKHFLGLFSGDLMLCVKS